MTPNPALVISECQQGILDPERSVTPALARQAAGRGIVPRIARLAEAFRAAGLPVVHCHIAHRPDLAGLRRNSLLNALAIKRRSMIEGTPDILAPPELTPADGDHVSLRTTGLTAFYGTDLDAVLRLRDVETLVVTGVSTNVAVPGLALEAVNRGYHVRIPDDCVAGTSPEEHEFMMRGLLSAVARITDSETVRREIAAPVPDGGRKV